jgi:hypothetical protein
MTEQGLEHLRNCSIIGVKQRQPLFDNGKGNDQDSDDDLLSPSRI